MPQSERATTALAAMLSLVVVALVTLWFLVGFGVFGGGDRRLRGALDAAGEDITNVRKLTLASATPATGAAGAVLCVASADGAVVPSSLQVLSDGNVQMPLTAVSTAKDKGKPGQMRWGVDADVAYVYVCTAVDTWQRVALATWPAPLSSPQGGGGGTVPLDRAEAP